MPFYLCLYFWTSALTAFTLHPDFYNPHTVPSVQLLCVSFSKLLLHFTLQNLYSSFYLADELFS